MDTEQYGTFWYQKKQYYVPIQREFTIGHLPRLGPIPKRAKFSTRNIYYRPRDRNPKNKIPYLLDNWEVEAGEYLFPRFFNDELVDKKFWGAPVNYNCNRSGVWPSQHTHELLLGNGTAKIHKKASLQKWLYYPERQCPTTLIIGNMGSGKSVLLNELANISMAKGEAVLTQTNVYLECRHIALTGKIEWSNELLTHPELDHHFIAYVELTPVEIFYHEDHPMDMFRWDERQTIERPNIKFTPFNDINQIIKAIAPNKVVAVFDDNIKKEGQSKLWFDLAYNLNRRKHMPYTINLTHNEASTLLPSHPDSGMFKQVQNFANEYIHFRKTDIRTIFASQLLTENFWRTNKKANYIFYKQGSKSDWVKDPAKRKMVQQLAIDESVLEYSGFYSLHSTPMFIEIQKQVKMDKAFDVDYGAEEEILFTQKDVDKTIKAKEREWFISEKEKLTKQQEQHDILLRNIVWSLRKDYKLSYRSIGQCLHYNHSTVGNWIKKMEKDGVPSLNVDVVS